MFHISSIAVVLTILLQHQALCFILNTYISQNGLHGEIQFIQLNSSTVELKTNLAPTLEYPDQVLSWSIHEFLVDYTKLENRCTDEELGKKLIDLESLIGLLSIPENSTTSWVLPVNLTGENGVWGRSLVLTNLNNNLRSCGSITSLDKSIERTAEARFYTPVSGSIYFRWIASAKTNHVDMLIYSHLYHNKPTVGKYNRQYTEHNWKIYVTDIFDSDDDKSEDNCNVLQIVYDPDDKGKNKGIGDVDIRVGKIRAAVEITKMSQKRVYRDIELSALSSAIVGRQRKLYIVMFDSQHEDSFMSCSKIRHVDSTVVNVILNGQTGKKEIIMTQYWKFEPTMLNFTSMNSVSVPVEGYKVHELPAIPRTQGTPEYCMSTGKVYDPLGKLVAGTQIPPPGYGTQAQYPIGDLSGKLFPRNGLVTVNPDLSLHWDIFLPLMGRFSILHRSLLSPGVLSNQPDCGTIFLKNGPAQAQMFTAKVEFRYPIVGRALFRQPKGQPWADTTILVEYLIHADGKNTNKSGEHRWAVHDNTPGKDFYNWTGRCLSAGDMYNPWNGIPGENGPCLLEICRVGDLSGRHGVLTIAGSKKEAQNLTRRLYTDPILPLQGVHKVLGRSLVIYDDIGTALRGDRLACTPFTPVYRRKAVARDWFPNGGPLLLKGKLEMTQQTEYDSTDIEVDFTGMEGSDYDDYFIHQAPVEVDLEFPCEPGTLGDTWDPVGSGKKNTGAINHQYAVGDLSGKIGGLYKKNEFHGSYNDSLLPLFGYSSVIGRSIAIHGRGKPGLGTTQANGVRRTCASLERGYSPGEARELKAVASFHNPAGHAYGYVRFTQLAHGDGEQSDTIIEVNLRHPGLHDRNVTRRHRWAIFVNPVGVDATVRTTATRCVAGGYTWNPYYTQLADPQNNELYDQECGPDNPLRCYAGDVSGRLGTLDIGAGRQVFTDPHFPLEGPSNALGRSLVLLGPDGSNDRFACANIEPEHDIIKYVNLRRPPKFVVAQFLQQIRKVMGLPPWMLSVDSRKTKTLHNGGCVQLVVHFKGPIASRLELDFSRLIGTGKLDEPSLSIPGFTDSKRKKTLSYSVCSTTDGRNRRNQNNSSSLKAGNRFGIFITVMLWICYWR